MHDGPRERPLPSARRTSRGGDAGLGASRPVTRGTRGDPGAPIAPVSLDPSLGAHCDRSAVTGGTALVRSPPRRQALRRRRNALIGTCNANSAGPAGRLSPLSRAP